MLSHAELDYVVDGVADNRNTFRESRRSRRSKATSHNHCFLGNMEDCCLGQPFGHAISSAHRTFFPSILHDLLDKRGTSPQAHLTGLLF